METLSEIADLARLPGPVHLAIGVFDGLHLGHQKVVRRALEGAARDGGSAVVVTFDPHPVRHLRPDEAPQRLASPAHQARLLARFGVGFLLVVRFDDTFAGLPAEAFIVRLAEACRPLKHICVGYEWRFGSGRGGDVHLLADLGERHGFEVTAIPAFKVDGETVSSTLIRDAVTAGDFGRARRFLGRDYAVQGTVVRGDGLGAQLGFPTANLEVENEQLPPFGVYAVTAVPEDDTPLPGVANFGVRPTVGGTREPTLEVHLFDTSPDLYGKVLEVRFRKRLRGERRFPDLDTLKTQIATDAADAKAVLGA